MYLSGSDVVRLSRHEARGVGLVFPGGGEINPLYPYCVEGVNVTAHLRHTPHILLIYSSQ